MVDIIVTDSGVGVESTTPTALLDLVEAGVGVETTAPSTTLTLTEAGVGVDALLHQLLMAEVGLGSEAKQTQLRGTDFGIAVDEPMLLGPPGTVAMSLVELGTVVILDPTALSSAAISLEPTASVTINITVLDD